MIIYADPDEGNRRITHATLAETLDVHIIPTYSCIGQDPAKRTCSDYQDDIALIRRRDGNWRGTNISDYLRINAGSLDGIDPVRLYAFGKSGANTATGYLRSMSIDITKSKKHWFRSTASEVAVCRGDSGGPYIGWESGYEVIAGIQSTNSNVYTCADPGDFQYAARTDSRVDWIKEKIGSACTKYAGHYMVCF